jgi:plastocyanin
MTTVALIAGSVVLTSFSAARDLRHDPATIAGTSYVAPAKARVVRVVGKDFSFDAPDVIPAGVTEFRFLNKGPSLHHMALLQLSGGKTVDDLRAALAKPGPMPAWVKEIGGPNAGAPGVESNATVNLEPGNYAIICFVDLGGPPHFVKGMLKGLRVVPSKTASAPKPKPDVTATLFDYGFRLSQPVKAGTRTIRVYNAGKQHHEVELVQLAPGSTAAGVLQWMEKMEGPPPGKALGGVAGIEAGMSESFTADFAKGRYALICFLPDAKDGKPHFAHGMIQEITVAE